MRTAPRIVGLALAVVLVAPLSSLASCVTEELDPITAVSRRVTTMSGEPIAKAAVSATDESGKVLLKTESDGTGVYQILNLKPGTYRIRLNASGYLSHYYTLVVSDKSSEEVKPIQLAPVSECHDIGLPEE